MEEPLSFVRNNPFVKNDGCRRVFRRAPLVPLTVQAPPPPPVLRATKMELDDAQDNISTGSASDIEYGPGIVEKLKAKFHRLSGMATKDAKVSPHATAKRCPSMDDILSSPDQQRIFSPPPEELSPIHRVHSKSTSDILAPDHVTEENRSFHVHRVVRIEPEEEEPEVPSISVLRRKFEQNVHRRPSQNLRYAKAESSKKTATSRPMSMDMSHATLASYSHEVASERDASHAISPPARVVSPPIYENAAQFYGADASIVSRTSQKVEDVAPAAKYVAESQATNRGNTATITPSPVVYSNVSAQPLRVFEAKREHKVEEPKAPAPLRVLEVLNHVVPEAEDEPEFVKIGRRLRRSSVHFEDLEERSHAKERVATEKTNERPHVEEETTEKITLVEEKNTVPTVFEAKKFGLRGRVELPSISAHARVIREGSVAPAEVMSPPDPDPSKHRSQSDVMLSPTIVQREERVMEVEGSPPPEEPRPTALALDSTESTKMSTLPSMLMSPPQLPTKNNDSGMSEMQQILSRFQKSRGGRYEVSQQPLATEKESPAVAVTAIHRPFVPAVVSIRSSSEDSARGAQFGSAPSQFGSAPSPPRPNVVSISVRDDSPTFAVYNNNYKKYEEETGISPISATVAKRPAPPPPVEKAPALQEAAPQLPDSPVESVPAPAAPTSTEAPRKSLSARYLEEKSKQTTESVLVREKPYGDDITEIKSAPKESSVDADLPEPQPEVHKSPLPSAETNASPEITASSFLKDSDTWPSSSSSEGESDDDEEILPRSRPFSINFPEPMLAGDGNPVRHTLLSLVMEEDIPQLMEAMSEKYSFEFVDLVDIPSTSSIIHPQPKRQQRRKERQVSSIRFQPEDPVVYAYLNESTTISSQQWLEGTEVDYDAYQRMIDAEHAEEEQRLQSSIFSRITGAFKTDMDWNTSEDSVGVTNTSPYSAHADSNGPTISV